MLGALGWAAMRSMQLMLHCNGAKMTGHARILNSPEGGAGRLSPYR